MHDLLACDPTLAYPTTHQCMFPNTFLVSGQGLNWMYELFMPAKRPFDDVPIGIERPHEEEFGLVNMGAGSLTVALPSPATGSLICATSTSRV